MEKTALITGGTDGIGRATAIELSKRGYSVHLLGINERRGNQLLDHLNLLYPDGDHRLFITDLSKKKEVNSFLDSYIRKFKKLDVLVLNAGIFPKKTILSDDGIDKSFSIGFVSRYMFSVKLNRLLSRSSIAKVVHINGSVVGSIRYSQLEVPTYGKMTSVWQNSVASALLVNYWDRLSGGNVAHTHWNPGIVNTDTVKSQGIVVRYLSKLMGMIEPERAGEMLAMHIDGNRSNDTTSRFFVKGKPQKVKKRIENGDKELNELIDFSEQFTRVKLSQI
jgi:NAD(P)-dependent dehydrogenase (short-subunit alcohol dehydrogenase family)